MASSGMHLTIGICLLTVLLHPVRVIADPNVAWTWPDSGAGGASGYVQCFRVWNDGAGPSLFVGGLFGTAGGQPIKNVARWNGQSWADLGGGISNDVLVLLPFNDGTGEALYAGGSFNSAGGVPAVNIAKWNGKEWSAVGMDLFSGPRALAVFDDGFGPALYAAASGWLRRWNGESWTWIPGVSHNFDIRSLTTFKNGASSLLYAGGRTFDFPPGPEPAVLAWDGKKWTPTAPLTGDNVYALKAFDDGSGPKLFAGGTILSAGGVPSHGVAIWNGTTWNKADAGLGGGFVSVNAFDTVESEGGEVLYAFGPLDGGVAARWTGSGWDLLKSETCCQGVLAGAVFDDGTGPRLHVGGSIFLEGKYKNIARTKATIGGGTPCGDLTGDGFVNQQDLGVLLGDFGCTKGVGLCPGDCDMDGDTDQADLGILLGNWEKPCP